MSKKHPLHELRLGLDIIALSDDIDALLWIKADIISKQSIRYCEGLKIWFEGREPFLLDENFNQKTAKKYLERELYESIY